MQMRYDVQQIIDKAINFYDLPNTANTTKAYREKIVRSLKDQGKWNDSKKRGQTFDEDTVRHTLRTLKVYFEKRSGSKYLARKRKKQEMEEDYLEQMANTEEHYDDGDYHENDIPYRYLERRHEFMLEALFFKAFDFDEDRYRRDMLLLQVFDPETVPIEYVDDYAKAIEHTRSFEDKVNAYLKDRKAL